MAEHVLIGPYEPRRAACHDHDPGAATVARLVGSRIEESLPGVVVEHVGSTSVPLCAGKGVVDLMVLYPPGGLREARQALDRLGFQRQGGRDPFPEERPMRVGSVDHEGSHFLLHAHVIAADSPEVAVMRAFRDRLRADLSLMDAYVARKRAILAAGVTDPLDYCNAKGGFVQDILGAHRVDKVNIREKLSLFYDHWNPRVVGELNGQHVKLVKFRGEFVWHRHDHEDELFLVVHGRFRMDFREGQVWLGEGEFLIVPRGVEHRPVAEEEVHVLLFEPVGTLNTGDVLDDRTVEDPQQI
jgi:GrpB-like predicted nucleotidyltransferase (UPF0157 family)/mannose-6-phosphate isomerase-like protein (cupin superfamily)